MACALQPIRIQTAPGTVESAIMHVIDMEASNADTRFTAMARQTPVHSFMFNRHGKLLVANDAATEACLHSVAGLKIPDGQDTTLKALFDLGAYDGDLSAAPLACLTRCKQQQIALGCPAYEGA